MVTEREDRVVLATSIGNLLTVTTEASSEGDVRVLVTGSEGDVITDTQYGASEIEVLRDHFTTVISYLDTVNNYQKVED